MKQFFAKDILLDNGWAKDVLIDVDSSGIITNIAPDAKRGDGAEQLYGTVIPGMPNLHSHAFQRAMAGLTEYAANAEDSFWSWRDLMYKFALKLTPEDIEAIAAQLYMEMLKAGYTALGEFHYLHHNLDGSPYERRAETSHAVIRAAQNSGIGITHIPVLYHFGGFGDQKPGDGQRRFINNVDGILEIIQDVQKTYADDPNISLGLSHHSLRAVNGDMMNEATKAAHSISPDMPIHIHIAEQMKEVNDCIEHTGKRPVEYLYDTIEVDEKWCLVHATHLNDGEIQMITKSGAVAGLCPTTEGNLGDGIFPLGDYIAANGRFGIGSDSHISVSVSEELRLLEYGQRLTKRRRNIAHSDTDSHIGAYLYKHSAQGGAQALGKNSGAIAVGKRFDVVVLNHDHALLYGREGDFVLDSFIFAGNDALVKDVLIGGKTIIRNGEHAREDEITRNYKRTLDRILKN